MLNPNKSVLLNTSTYTDVQYVGGEILIQGLEPIKKSRVTDFSQINYRAEVVQVVTIGATAYTPVANTKYTVLIGDPSRRTNGQGEFMIPYSYVTPANITSLGATAALQRDAISVALCNKINAVNTNWCVAAVITPGAGTGFTITDDAGYYPYNHQGMTNRLGANIVKLQTNSDGSGFDVTNIALTTAAVYSVGVGATLASNAPVYDLVTGNLIQGEIYNPKTVGGAVAVSGQKYNMFSISYLADSALPTIANEFRGFKLRNVSVWVDNGAGSATTNLTGYISFERAMHRLFKDKFALDPAAFVEFFDRNFLIQGPLGAVPTTGPGVKNKLITPYDNLLNHYNICPASTQTIVAPTQGDAGLLIEQDTTATKGAHYCTETATISPREFVVGKQEVTVLFKASATNVANIVLMAGLRSKEAFNAAFGSYANLAAAGTGPAGTNLYTYGTLASAANVATNTTYSATNSKEFTVVMVVKLDGTVSIWINDIKVPVYSVGTTPLVFTAGTVLIPFFQYTNLNSAAAVPNVTEFFALPSAKVFYY